MQFALHIEVELPKNVGGGTEDVVYVLRRQHPILTSRR